MKGAIEKAVQLAKLFYVASSRRVREKPNT